MDRNGTLDLVIRDEYVGTHAEAPLYGPWRVVTHVITWNGSKYVLLPPKYDPPTYRFQTAQDGDRAFQRWDFEEALQLYQRVLNDRTLKGWSEAHFQYMQDALQAKWLRKPTPLPTLDDNSDYPALTAYARFKILLIHLAQGQADTAKSEYERLQQDYPEGQPGSGFTEMGKAFRNEYEQGHNLADGCLMAFAYAAGHAAETSEQIDVTWHGWQSPDYHSGQDLCPFNK